MVSTWVLAFYILLTITIITVFCVIGIVRTHELDEQAVAQLFLPHQILTYVSSADVVKRDPNVNIGMVAYYINMKRSKDRREHMDAQKKKLGVYVFSRMPAVDGKLLVSKTKNLVETNDLVRFTNKGFSIKSMGELAVTLSHLKAIKLAYESGKDYTLICEDDISLSYVPFWRKPLRQLLKDMPQNGQLLRLFYHEYPESDGDFSCMAKYPEDSPLRWGAVAYVITREGAKRILDRTWDEDNQQFVLTKESDLPTYVADYYIYDLIGLKDVYTYKTPLFYTNNFTDALDSTLHKDQTPMHLATAQKIFGAFVNA